MFLGQAAPGTKKQSFWWASIMCEYMIDSITRSKNFSGEWPRETVQSGPHAGMQPGVCSLPPERESCGAESFGPKYAPIAQQDKSNCAS